MKIKSTLVAIISFVFVFAGIAIASSLGWWQTESTKVPMTFSEGDFEGQPMPEDIRGSYTFLDIENAFGVKAVVLSEAFHINRDDPSSVQAKEIEEIYGEFSEDIEIGTGSVRKFVALYTGLPYEGEEYLLTGAVEVLKAENKWTEEMEVALEGYILDYNEFSNNMDIPTDLEETESATSENQETGSQETGSQEAENQEAESTETSGSNLDVEEHEEEIGIKGKTTVADAISYGIPLEKIEEILGVKVSNKNMLIKDICTQNELSFSSIKEELAALLE